MSLAVRAGTLIDGTGQAPRKNVTILVDDDRVTRVITDANEPIPSGYETVDATTYTVMPGLIDSHLHITGSGDPRDRSFGPAVLTQSIGTLALKAYRNTLRDLEAGYTTVRDAASPEFVNVAVRDAINGGLLPGPRVWACGLGVTSTSGHMDREKSLAPHVTLPGLKTVADGPVEGRRAVRINLRFDVDFIKMNVTLSEHVRRYGWQCGPEMTRDTIEAVIEEAHWHGRPVTAHCHGGPGVTWAIEAGIDGLEHAYFLSDEQLDMMAERGTAFCPTLSVMGHYKEQRDEGFEDKTKLDRWRSMAIPAAFDSVRRARERGVRIIAGTDSAMPGIMHGTNAYELKMLVEAGLTPMEAIVAATGDAAAGIGFDEVGSVAEGKFADLIFVQGNPLDDVTILQDLANIPVVIKGGQVVVDRREGGNGLPKTGADNLVLA